MREVSLPYSALCCYATRMLVSFYKNQYLQDGFQSDPLNRLLTKSVICLDFYFLDSESKLWKEEIAYQVTKCRDVKTKLLHVCVI